MQKNSDADLSGAVLRGANLSDADLRDAVLRGADLFDEKITKEPLQIQGLVWHILITEKHIKIGCEVHTAEEWDKFDDRRIIEMDGKAALEWWRKNKEFVLSAHRHHVSAEKGE